MLKIQSKKVLSFRTNPRIDEQFFDQVQEHLNPIGPTDPNKKKYDSGKPRMTQVDQWLGMGGSEDRATSAGPGVGMSLGQEDGREDELHKDHSLSSGYNADDHDGPVQDDSGPGLTPTTPDPYNAVRTNELFLDQELMSGGRDKSRMIRQFVDKILNGPDVPRRHERHSVDRRLK